MWIKENHALKYWTLYTRIRTFYKYVFCRIISSRICRVAGQPIFQPSERSIKEYYTICYDILIATVMDVSASLIDNLLMYLNYAHTHNHCELNIYYMQLLLTAYKNCKLAIINNCHLKQYLSPTTSGILIS